MYPRRACVCWDILCPPFSQTGDAMRPSTWTLFPGDAPVAGLWHSSPDGTRADHVRCHVGRRRKRFGTALGSSTLRGSRGTEASDPSAKGDRARRFLPRRFPFTPPPGTPMPKPMLRRRRTQPLVAPRGRRVARLWRTRREASPAWRGPAVVGSRSLGVAPFPGTKSLDEDGERFKARRDAGVTGAALRVLSDPSWDHYPPLGPRERQTSPSPPLAGVDRPHVPATRAVPTPGASLTHSLNCASLFDQPSHGRLHTCHVRIAWGRTCQWTLVEVDQNATGEHACFPPSTLSMPPWPVPCPPTAACGVACSETLGQPRRRPHEVTLWLGLTSQRGGRDLLPAFDSWAKTPLLCPRLPCVLSSRVRRRAGSRVRRRRATGVVPGPPRRAHSPTCVHLPSAISTRCALRNLLPQEFVALDARASDQDPPSHPTPGVPSPSPAGSRRGRNGSLQRIGPPPGWCFRAERRRRQPAPLVLWIPAAPWLVERVARGGGTMFPVRPGVSRCCSPTRRCRPAMDRLHPCGGFVAGGPPFHTSRPDGGRRRLRSARPEIYAGAHRCHAASRLGTWPTGSPATPTASVRSSPQRQHCGPLTHVSTARPTVGHGWERSRQPVRYPRRYERTRPHRSQNLPGSHAAGPRTTGSCTNRVPVGEALRLWTDHPSAVSAVFPAKFLTSPTEPLESSRRRRPGVTKPGSPGSNPTCWERLGAPSVSSDPLRRPVAGKRSSAQITRRIRSVSPVRWSSSHILRCVAVPSRSPPLECAPRGRCALESQAESTTAPPATRRPPGAGEAIPTCSPSSAG